MLLSALFSSGFRLAAFLFLHIIPSRLLRVPIPALFAAWLLARDKATAHETRPPLFATLLLSLPTHSRALSVATAAINVVIFLAVLDFAASPFLDAAPDLVFTRIGAVYPDSATVVARYPALPIVHVLYREAAPDAPWKQGPQLNLSAHTDWVATAPITALWPSTPYEYVLAHPNSTLLPYPANPIPFRTFPDPRLPSPSRFRFVASSCTVPNFPYRGPLHRRSIKGFDLLADYLDAKSKPQPPHVPALGQTALNATAQDDAIPTEFMLFLGDFIYADVPFYGGDDKEAYRRLYRRNYQSPSYRRIYEKLPVFHAYDDHEFIDNYAGQNKETAPFPNASNAYNIYAGDANYAPARPDQGFYDFRHGDVAFFVMDTRRYRSAPDVSDDERTMLGAEQLGALYDWLAKVNTTASFKFVVSSVPFTTLFTYDAQVDTWAAFRTEQAAVLRALQSVPNVVVISGDRHQFAAIEFPAPPASSSVAHTVHEISTSPLSMFYIPFIPAIQQRSAAFFTRNVTLPLATSSYEISSSNETLQIQIEDQIQIEEQIPHERVLKYISAGNYKWSAFEIDTRDAGRPTLRIETVIDGRAAYHLEIIGVPVKTHVGLSALVPHGVINWLARLGMAPAKWF